MIMQVGPKTVESAGNEMFISAGDAFGTDQVGGRLTLSAGRSTGNSYNEIFFNISDPGSSGTGLNDTVNIGGVGYDGLWCGRHFIFFSNYVADATFLVDPQYGSDLDGNSLTVRGGTAGTGGVDHLGGNLVLQSGKTTGTGTASIDMQVPLEGTTGNTLNDYTTKISITQDSIETYGELLNDGEKIVPVPFTEGVAVKSLFQGVPLTTISSTDVTLEKILVNSIPSVQEIHAVPLKTVNNIVSIGSSGTNALLTVVNFPNLETVGVGGFRISSQLLDFDAHSLKTIAGALTLANFMFTDPIDLSNLTSVGGEVYIVGLMTTSFDLSTLATIGQNGAFTVFPNLTTVDFTGLVSVFGDFNIDDLTILTSLSFPALTTVGSVFSIGNGTGLPALTSLSLPVFATATNGISFQRMDSLVSLDLSALTTTTGNISVNINSGLTTIILNHTLNALALYFDANALNQACVDDILDALDDAGYSGGTLDLTGGTNATPSNPAGLASKANLVGKGWTVTNN